MIQGFWYNLFQCSITCGEGYHRRQVKCLDASLKEATNCAQNTKPLTAKPCSKEASPPQTQRPHTPNCRDKYSSCQVVVQARLCKLPYNNNLCCESCRLDCHYVFYFILTGSFQYNMYLNCEFYIGVFYNVYLLPLYNSLWIAIIFSYCSFILISFIFIPIVYPVPCIIRIKCTIRQKAGQIREPRTVYYH